MARFYGTVQGGRGEATRLGHGDLYVTAQSYSGDIVVRLYKHDKTDEDWCTISVRGHDNSVSVHTLYAGPIQDLLSMDARDSRLKALGLEGFTKRFERGEVA